MDGSDKGRVGETVEQYPTSINRQSLIVLINNQSARGRQG